MKFCLQNGRDLLLLGRETFIKIESEELGLLIDVLILSGETEAETEAALAEFMKDFIGPNAL